MAKLEVSVSAFQEFFYSRRSIKHIVFVKILKPILTIEELSDDNLNSYFETSIYGLSSPEIHQFENSFLLGSPYFKISAMGTGDVHQDVNFFEIKMNNIKLLGESFFIDSQVKRLHFADSEVQSIERLKEFHPEELHLILHETDVTENIALTGNLKIDITHSRIASFNLYSEGLLTTLNYFSAHYSTFKNLKMEKVPIKGTCIFQDSSITGLLSITGSIISNSSSKCLSPKSFAILINSKYFIF